MQKRIYVVTSTETGKQALVRASNRVAARNTMTRTAFIVELANQEQLIDLVAKGVTPIDESSAGLDQAELPMAGEDSEL